MQNSVHFVSSFRDLFTIKLTHFSQISYLTLTRLSETEALSLPQKHPEKFPPQNEQLFEFIYLIS